MSSAPRPCTIITDRFFGLADGLIERFGGTIDKHIGDCVMAVFGAPVAHGNDPERAVRAALAIRDAMPDLSRELGCELNTHIGIASGQVVASGGAGHKTYSITGNSVNLASRLTDQAGPRRRSWSRMPVRRPAGRSPRLSRGRRVEVKGHRAVAACAPSGCALREARTAERPFVGRRAELQQFEGVLEACLDVWPGPGSLPARRGGHRQDPPASRSCSVRPRHRVRLPQGAGARFRHRRRPGCDPARSCAACSGSARRATRRAASAALEARRARRAARGADRRVFLNDLLDLPQPTELRALYDAMDTATRSRGRQDDGGRVGRVAPAMRRRGCSSSRTCTGPIRPTLGPPGEPRPDGGQRAARCWS